MAASGSCDIAPIMPAAVDIWRQRIRAETLGNYSIVMGVSLLKLGESAAALTHLSRADTQLATVEARYLLIQALHAEGQVDEAARLRQQAIAHSPNFELEGLGGILDRLADSHSYDDSVFLIRNAPDQLLDRSVDLKARLVDLLLKMGCLDAAYEAVLAGREALLGTQADVLVRLGEAKLKAASISFVKQDWEKAHEMAGQAALLLDRRADALYLLSQARITTRQQGAGEAVRVDQLGLAGLLSFLIAQGCYDEADAVLGAGSAEIQQQAEILPLAVQIAAGLKDYDRAATRLSAAKQAGADRSALAWCYQFLFTELLGKQGGKWPIGRVCDIASDWTDHAPDEVASWLGRGRVLLLADKIPEAAEAYGRASVLDPEINSLALLYLGLAHLAQNRLDAAGEAFERLLTRSEHAVHYATWLGLVRQAQGARAKAIELHMKTANGQVETGFGWSNLGLVYLAEGNLDAAQDAQNKALSTENPPKGWIWSNLGTIESRRGKAEQADRLFRKASGEAAFSRVHARIRAWVAPEILFAYDRMGLVPPI